MIDVPAATSLLLASLVIVGGVLALSATMRRIDSLSTPSGPCHVCSSATATTTVNDDPVCPACKREYYGSVR